MALCSQRRQQYFLRRAVENIMSFNDANKKVDVAAIRTHESGFSMVELMIVSVVMVVIAGLAVPNIFRTYQNYQLDAAGHSIASLLQQARMQAVKTNLPAYANFTNTASGNIAFVSTDNSTTYAAGEPDVQLSPAVSFQTAPPDHAQLDAYLNGGKPQGGGSSGFYARGLPRAGNGGYFLCCPSPA